MTTSYVQDGVRFSRDFSLAPGYVSYPMPSISGAAALPSTELTPVERAYFAYLPPLREADVARVRRLLQHHRGDLRDLV